MCLFYLSVLIRFLNSFKNVYFQSKILDIFLFLLKTYVVGTHLILNRPPWTSFYTAKLGHGTRVYIIFLTLTI